MTSPFPNQPHLPGSLPSKFAPEVVSFPKGDEDSLNLRIFWSILRRRWWLIILAWVAVSTAIGFRVLNEVPRYQSQFRLLIEPIASDESFERLNQRLIGQMGSQLDYQTQIQVLGSPTVMEPIAEKIKKRYHDIDYGFLSSNIGIVRVEATKILEISLQDSDPQKLQFILEQVAQGFIEYSQKEQKTGKQKGLEFVEKQTESLEKRVDELQGQVQKFRQQNNLLDPDVQGQAVADRLATILKERQLTQRESAEQESLYQKLQGQLNIKLDQAVKINALSEAPRYQALLDQLQEIETKIALESARYTEENPNIIALRDRRTKLLPLIEKEALIILGAKPIEANLTPSPNSLRVKLTQDLITTINQRQILAVREAALALGENQARTELQKYAVLSRQYADLKRQLDVATESLSRFLAAQEDLQIESAQRTISWELLNAPQTPIYPISPNIPRGVMLAVVAGLIVGGAVGLIAEKLDVRFHSPEDLQDTLGLPLLGTIPYRKKFKERKGAEKAAPVPFFGGRYRASPFLEAFRSLNANLSFFTPDKPLQTLVISSSVPLEGKSTTSLHLAQAAAAMGKRVLLVDADLRRPQVHAMTDLPNVWGLSHIISIDLDIDDIIQRSPSEDNLFILTAGQIPPDPTRLLSSQKMRLLIDRFRESFDLIIFDTPPMLGLADAKFLAAQTDALLVVVRLGWTDRTLLKQVLENLKVSQTGAIGLIANRAKDYSSGSYHYYHRYFQSEDDPKPPKPSKPLNRKIQ